MITVYVDRDSVAMGDDVDPHVVGWQFEDTATRVTCWSGR